MFFINHIRKYFVNRSISKHKANMEQFRNAWNQDNKEKEDTGTISLHNKFVTEQKSYSNLNKMTTDGTLKKGFGMGSTDGLAGVTQNLSALGKEFTEDDFKMPDATYLVSNHDAAVLPLDNLINACVLYFKNHQTTETDQRKRTVGQKRLDFVRFAKRKAENKKYCLYYERCVQGIKKFWPDIEGGGIRKGKLMGNSLNPTQMNQQSAMQNEMQQKGKVQGAIHKIEEEKIIKR